ncbi:MAG: hypothetical protein IT262_23765, partial [Saprospiraceae bacterium]|nr:hypothetical protein [Saprospiraceae bacterium]
PEQGAAMASGKETDLPGIVSTGAPVVKNALPEIKQTPATTNLAPSAASPESERNMSEKDAENQTDRVVPETIKPIPVQQKDKEKKSGISSREEQKQNKARTTQNNPRTETDRKGHTIEANRLSGIDQSTNNTNPTPENAVIQVAGSTQTAQGTPESTQPDAAALPGDTISAQGAIVPKNILLLQALELPFPPASHTNNKLLLLKKMPKQYAVDIKPAQNQRITFDASFAVSSWKKDWGYTAGVMGYYPLGAHWSLGAGLQLRYLPLAPVGPEPDSSENISVQYRYSFGFERTELRRSAFGLHYLELPIAAQWQRGRLGLEAGVAPAVLLLVRDQVTETKETSLTGVETLSARKTWGEKTNFRRGYLNTFIMAEWQVVSGLGLTIQGNYRPGSLRKPVENIVPEKGAWGLDLGMRWRF